MSSDDDGEHQDHFRGKRHREQSILGIFGDQDSDHDETASKRSASAAIRGRPLASKPVSFISTGPTVPADAVQNAARQPVQSADIRKAAVPIEKVDKDFAAFEKAGSGFGSRMLEKMGWVKGRAIGKNGQGVVNPIEARLRPNSMGLGFGGYHETTAKAKQQQSRILHSGDQDVAVESENSGDEYGSRQNMELAPPTSKQQHWKKHEKRELKVTSAAELRAQWAGGVESKSDAAATAGSMKVVDMRGPQTRVHSSVQNALSAGAQLTMGLEGKGGLVPELHHNVRMSVEVAEANLDLKHRELRNERQTLATLTKRRDSLAAEVRVAAAQLQESAALAHAVTEAAAVTDAEIKRARSTSMIELDTATRPESYSEGEGSHMIDWGGTRVPFSAASSALINAANKWYDVRKAHPEGFIAWELDDVAASMVAETLRRMFRHWRPLAHPSLGIAVVQSWRRALGSNLSGVAGVSLVGKAYAALIHLAIMPALRGALTNEWEPRSSEIAITVLSAWQQLLPDVLWRELFARQVLPRLASELSSWEFKADPTPPHLWLHPWLPLLPSPGLAALLPTLRHKLANSLAGIGVETPKAVELLYPWRTVLDLASWQGLVSRHVLPHLEHCLTTKLTINPAEQDVQPFIRVLSWTKVLSIEELSGLLLRHFFPVWLRTLERWVDQRPNFNELSCWYMGWKTLLQDQVNATPTEQLQCSPRQSALHAPMRISVLADTN